jgi:hypothetical protein
MGVKIYLIKVYKVKKHALISLLIIYYAFFNAQTFPLKNVCLKRES